MLLSHAWCWLAEGPLWRARLWAHAESGPSSAVQVFTSQSNPPRRLGRGRASAGCCPLAAYVLPSGSPPVATNCLLVFLSSGCVLPSFGSCISLRPEGCPPFLNIQTCRSLPLHLEDRSWCLSARRTHGELLSGGHAAFASSQPRHLGLDSEWRAFLFVFFPLEGRHHRTPLPPGFQTAVLCPRRLQTLRPRFWHWLAGPPVARLRLLSVPPQL